MDRLVKTPRSASAVVLATSSAWLLQGLISVVLRDPTGALDISMILPMSLAFVAIWHLSRLGWTGSGRFGAFAVAIFGIAAVTAIPGQIAMAFDMESLKWAAFPVSAITFVGGLVLAGIAMLRAGIASKWTGWALIAAQPLAMAIGIALSPISPLVDSGDYTGAMGHGIVWALIGASMLGKRIPLLGFSPATAEATGKA